MEKRYQVFLSSTYADLMEERRLVIQALMEMDCIPSGMEIFPAADEEQWEFIKKVIDDCDYYILIIGGRYGSLTADGISYTEKEYDYAVSKGIKVIALLHKNPNQLPAKNIDGDPRLREKLEVFRKRVSQGPLAKFWEKANELPGMVALSLNKTIKTFPAVGWVRADQAQATVTNVYYDTDQEFKPFLAQEEANRKRILLRNNRHRLDVFVLMPFASQYQAFYDDVIKKTVEDMNLVCMRADDFFLSTPIMDDILNSIRDAKFLIADFSGRNSNVFFEVGIAHALGKSVIFITQNLQDVPPKLRTVRCHIYKNDLSGSRDFPVILKKAVTEIDKNNYPAFFKIREMPLLFDKNLCITLLPPNEAGDQVYSQLVLAVMEQLGIDCVRVTEIFDIDSLLERMWAQIHKSHIVLADLTDRDPDVFYLAGLAFGLGKKVVCLSQRLEDIPFDFKHKSSLIYSLETYDKGKKAKNELHQIIKSLI